MCRVYAALKLYILVDVDIDIGNGFCGKQMLICVLNWVFFFLGGGGGKQLFIAKFLECPDQWETES